jgi:hypothetical protein
LHLTVLNKYPNELPAVLATRKITSIDTAPKTFVVNVMNKDILQLIALKLKLRNRTLSINVDAIAMRLKPDDSLIIANTAPITVANA